jgi:hypothetical protein
MYHLLIQLRNRTWFEVGNDFESVDAARAFWCIIATRGGTDLVSFEIEDSKRETVYQGNFITDEC